MNVIHQRGNDRVWVIWTFILPLLFVLVGCSDQKEPLIFERLNNDDIVFVNKIEETPDINIFKYEYTYNGGGVAAADFNNDGKTDLYFSGNAVPNALYLNRGKLEFEDISELSGVKGRSMWKTGVSAVDINADGWVDIYLCYSGPDTTHNLTNQLFINEGPQTDGVPRFTERAKEYGLDAPATFSTQAAFFDYDRDGDLDMFLVNHGNHFYSPFANTRALRNSRHPNFGNRLYKNRSKELGLQSPKFLDVSTEAGIHGGGINFGLGAGISDINNDGWPDIYVTNDYEEQDYLYLNNKDGSFTDVTKSCLGHMSRNGMGTDIADYNNDGLMDIMEVDMWPEDNYRQKLLKGPDDFNRYNLMVDSGFHHQQMRNTLQLNAGVGPDGKPLFQEVGQLAGVSSTDWSWAPLFFDFDNDGFKDLFVSNGYLRDFTSMDFLKYTVEDERNKAQSEGRQLEVYDLVSKMSSTKTKDYLFRNNGDLTFQNVTDRAGMGVPNLSFGAAYADLDDDGDLEVITNNTNEPVSIWINNTNKTVASNYLRIKLKSTGANTAGIGSRVTIKYQGREQMTEFFPSRGFQSSVEHVVHFGLADIKMVDTLKVIWPNGQATVRTNIKVNEVLVLEYDDQNTTTYVKKRTGQSALFAERSEEMGITFSHKENPFNDFDVEPLLPYQLSKLGPALAVGDVNGDEQDDMYFGGASGQAGRLYVSTASGNYKLSPSQPWDQDALSEDVAASFFDVDNDEDLDLFVVTGGTEFPVGSAVLDDRLYVNESGRFVKSNKTIADHASGSCVAPADFDKDGDVDLYIGGRILPGSFPMTTPGALLRNETNQETGIKFSVVTNQINSALRQPGMVTDAMWVDFNGDSWKDLFIVGDWMHPRLFANNKGNLTEVNSPLFKTMGGLWSKIAVTDVDRDGDEDYLLGNAGNNLPWQVSRETPLRIYYGDFNGDQKIDPVMTSVQDKKDYPVASRDELLLQMNNFRKRFTTYAQYGKASISQILEGLRSDTLIVHTTSSTLIRNDGNGMFKRIDLPVEAQVSRVSGFISADFDEDGFVDVLLAGNFYPYRTQFGACDASVGLLLLGNGSGNFKPVPYESSGFLAQGDVRDMRPVKTKNGRLRVVLVRNNDKISIIEHVGLPKLNL